MLVFCCSIALAQDRYIIHGQVRAAENGEPLPGASVTVNRSPHGVFTDENGRFSIPAASLTGTISVSYVGREAAEIPLKGDTSVTINLKASNKQLDEVVAVAYATVKKSAFPGSVSSIQADKIENRQTSNITNALQGLVAGVQTESASGQPGNASDIRIRGVGSVNASSSPLFVLDGAPYYGDINAINPADVQSITVLKDATAANLYGASAANGVIVITTKQGKKSDNVAVTATVNQGWSSRAVKDYAQLNTQQYFELTWEAIRNNQLDNGLTADAAARKASELLTGNQYLNINPYGPGFPQPVGPDGKLVPGAKLLWNDNWEDAMHQNAGYTQAQLSLSGGNDKGNYYISGGYLDNQGLYLKSGFKRYSIRSNVNLQARKWLRVGLDFNAASTTQDAPPSTDSQTGNVVNFGRSIPGFYPIYQRNPDGAFILDDKGQKQFDFGTYRPSAALANENLVGSIPLDKYRLTRENASARTFAEATLYKGLKFKTSYNVDYISSNGLTYYNSQYGDYASIGGLVDKSSSRTVSYTWNNILTYDHDFTGGHHLNLLAGHEYYSFNYTDLSGERQHFSYPGFYEPVAASVLNSFTGQSDVYNKLSFFGQGQYSFRNKYYFTASLRSDASSRFSPQERWGTFYSAGASWHMADEPWLSDVTWINALTPKVSYGASGNDNLTDNGSPNYYAYQALYAITPNQSAGGATTLRLATPNLKWESNVSTNVAVDFAFFRNRLSGTIGFYNRQSKDLLFPKPLTPSTGFSTIYANIGSLRNRGWEFEFNVIPVSTKDFRWNLAVNGTFNKNKITSLPQEEIISGTKKLMVGKSIYEFYIRQWAGVDPKNGDPLWYTTDAATGAKTTTNLYKNAGLYYSGSSLPDVYGGITNTFDYKGFELSFMVSYSLGGKVLDGDYLALMNNGNSFGHSWSTEILDRWTPEHTNTDVPRLSTITQGAWNQASTRFLYSASYARLKYATLAYNLPKAWMQRANVTNLKVYVTGENLLTFYGHKGMDPEQSVDGTTFYQYPTLRTLSVGLQLGF